MATTLPDIITLMTTDYKNYGFYDAHIPDHPVPDLTYASIELPTTDAGVPLVTGALQGPGLSCCPSGHNYWLDTTMLQLMGG